jgi:hypothetical protein
MRSTSARALSPRGSGVTTPQIPHTMDHRERYAVVSCHVERPLDDRVWRLFSRLQERAPGGFRIAALIRPPDTEAGEDEAAWLERAREAAARGPLGQHTHWTGPAHARPTGGDPAERVRREGEWLRARGLPVTLFCGGGWYMDAAVAEAAAALGYADCTATAFRPSYLPAGAPRLALDRPARLALPSGARLVEIPSTHSLGMLVRGVAGKLAAPVVHAYFHDTDLLDRRRRLALPAALRLLARRRAPARLDELGDGLEEVPFSAAASAR